MSEDKQDNFNNIQIDKSDDRYIQLQHPFSMITQLYIQIFNRQIDANQISINNKNDTRILYTEDISINGDVLNLL